MNKKWVAVLALSLVLGIFVLQSRARPRAGYLHPATIGFFKETSWIDQGIKAIIFEDG